jgi:hypothetical protein
VAGVIVPESVQLRPEDSAEDAANAFERYDLFPRRWSTPSDG